MHQLVSTNKHPNGASTDNTAIALGKFISRLPLDIANEISEYVGDYTLRNGKFMRKLWTKNRDFNLDLGIPRPINDFIFSAREMFDFKISWIPDKINGKAELKINSRYIEKDDYYVERRYVLNGPDKVEYYEFWSYKHEMTEFEPETYNIHNMKQRIIAHVPLLQ